MDRFATKNDRPAVLNGVPAGLAFEGADV